MVAHSAGFAAPHGPSGVVPVLVTPYDDRGRLDPAALHRELDALHAAGVEWVAIGYGSEIDRLEDHEQRALVEAIAGRPEGPALMANLALRGLGREDVRDRLAILEDAGARAVLIRPGGAGSDTAERLAEQLGTASINLVLQDAPQTGVVMDAAQLAQLVHAVPAMAGLKIEPASDTEAKMADLRDALGGSIVILGGNGGRAYVQERRHGSDGTMPGPAYPELFHRIDVEIAAGRWPDALAIQAAHIPLADASATDGIDSFIYAQKRVLVRRGVLTSDAVRGYVPAPAVRARIESAIDAFLTDERSGIVRRMP